MYRSRNCGRIIKSSFIFTLATVSYYQIKVTAPELTRGRIGLYLIMCWSPFSKSTISSLKRKNHYMSRNKPREELVHKRQTEAKVELHICIVSPGLAILKPPERFRPWLNEWPDIRAHKYTRLLFVWPECRGVYLHLSWTALVRR